MLTPSSRIFGLGAALLVALVSAQASADQVVVFDQTWVHSADLPDSHFRMPASVGTPEDWVSPIDYAHGSAWVYLEVLSKPTDQETKFQVCFEATPTYGCTYQSPTYTEVGVYEWETPFDAFWSPPGESVDWTQGVNQIACILKDTMNGKPSADNVGREVAALYMPTEVRLVVTLVEQGSIYEPPSPAGASTGSDGGSEDDGDETSHDAGGDTTGSATGPGTDDDTSTPADDDGPGEDDDGPSTPGATGSASGDASSTGSDPGSQHDDPSGCACTARPRSAPTSWALLGLLLARTRRGRR